MKPLDHLEYLDAFTAELVVLTTYNIDPVFFERRVLRRKALDRAKRIAVLVDADEWSSASRADLPIRWANCRYLVVPISRRQGVFHPKVGLFLSESDAVVSCGSGNLTRPGITHNLEIQNIVHAVCEDGTWSPTAAVASQALEFVASLAASADSRGAAVLRDWLSESWSYQLPKSDSGNGPVLLHTSGGDLWGQVSDAIDAADPQRITILSPFYDDDLALLQRLRDSWPTAQIAIVAQSQSSSLDAPLAHQIDSSIELSTLNKGARRLHAKLLAWEGAHGSGYLVGSANFTSAAFDGRNIEACLLVRGSANLNKSLFGKGFAPTPIDPNEFVKGATSEPKPEDESETFPLRIKEAFVDNEGRLSLAYSVEEPDRWESVSVGLRGVRDSDPSFTRPLAKKVLGTAQIDISESPFASRGEAIRCSLIGNASEERIESRVAWVVQEDKLTHERGTSRSSRVRKRIEESGSGLAEQLAEIGVREGYGGVIEFLDQVNIRFYDGGGRAPGGRALNIRIADPWEPGKVPKWMDDDSVSAADLKRLGKAICDYADRHEKTRLRRHAKKGNINGLENFCDVLSSTAQILLTGYCHWRQGEVPAVPRNQIIGRLCRYIELATVGYDKPRQTSPGYLTTLLQNMRGDRKLLKERCESSGIAGLLLVILRTAQTLRFLADDVQQNSDATRLLPDSTWMLRDTLDQCGVQWPSDEQAQGKWQELRTDGIIPSNLP